VDGRILLLVLDSHPPPLPLGTKQLLAAQPGRKNYLRLEERPPISLWLLFEDLCGVPSPSVFRTLRQKQSDCVLPLCDGYGSADFPLAFL